MINNVKVKPIRKVESSLEMESCYKSTFFDLEKENVLIVIILPF